MPETTIFKFPTPDGAESNDVERHLQLLAQRIEQQLDIMYPIGLAWPYLFDGPPPTGFTYLKGQVASAITYPRLAARIGNVVNNTFVLPNFTGMVPRGALPGEDPGQVIGADELILTVDELPVHAHSGEDLSITGNHVHNPGTQEYLITQPTPQVHAIQAFNGGGGPGNVQVTFTKNEFMDNNAMDIGGSTSPAGGGQPIDIRPKSRLVNWITRGA